MDIITKGEISMKERIKRLRKQNHMTQVQAAEEIGCSVTSLERWETGRNAPSEDNLQRIAKVFHTSEEYLLTGKGSENDPKPTKQTFKPDGNKLVIKREKSKNVPSKVVAIDYCTWMEIKQTADELNLSIGKLTQRLLEFGLDNLVISED